jgi:hypothetical protein
VTNFVRPALLAIAASASLSMGGAHAASASGKPILKAMIKASAKLTSVHTTGSVQGPSGTLSLSGDCTGGVHRVVKTVQLANFKVMSWVRGSLSTPKKTSSVDVHLISVQIGTAAPQTWSRSPSSHNRWRVAGRGAGIAEIYSSDICLPLYAAVTFGIGSVSWQNLGTQSVNGSSAWHIQTTHKVAIETTVTDLYVDTSSHELLRYDNTVTVTRTHGVTRTSLDFSGFNRKLNIVPPKIGATRP